MAWALSEKIANCMNFREGCYTYDYIATDDWRSFLQVFGKENHEAGKAHTVRIEGNNRPLL